jgi:sulfide dehydrogenase cytochrome subunit
VWFRRWIARSDRTRIAFLITAGVVILGARGVAAGEDDQGFQIAATCAACHGPAGSEQRIPAVAGLDEQTLIRAMQAFRSSEVPSHVMHAVALSLTNEELASVAHYLATSDDKASSP